MRLLIGEAIFWIAAACCLVSQFAILRAALRAPDAPPDPQVPRPHPAWEAAWGILPALVLIGVFALTWKAMHRPDLPSSFQIVSSALRGATGR